MSNAASRPDSVSGSDPAALEKGPAVQNLVELAAGAVEQKPVELKEGGTKAWLTVVGSAVGMFVSFGWVNCIGLFQAEYETNQLKDYSSSDVAWITSLECKTILVTFALLRTLVRHANGTIVFFLLAFAPVAGKLFNSYGPRVPILIGSVMHVFGLMITSISSQYYQIMLSQSVCSRIRSSLIFTPSLTAVGYYTSLWETFTYANIVEQPQTWFRKKRGIAGGLVIAGSSLGGVVFPLMV
jgi:hypothetical protein